MPLLDWKFMIDMMMLMRRRMSPMSQVSKTRAMVTLWVYDKEHNNLQFNNCHPPAQPDNADPEVDHQEISLDGDGQTNGLEVDPEAGSQGNNMALPGIDPDHAAANGLDKAELIGRVSANEESTMGNEPGQENEVVEAKAARELEANQHPIVVQAHDMVSHNQHAETNDDAGEPPHLQSPGTCIQHGRFADAADALEAEINA